ncbi:hypothetical protein ACQ4M4_26440, partial [Leptolyngbya sp. AN02str]|uniref:hypothetical protein n=1 Tax=Leptolyngbya sp. AN02str TaxID=3423363 RepID=UPI003D314793
MFCAFAKEPEDEAQQEEMAQVWKGNKKKLGRGLQEGMGVDIVAKRSKNGPHIQRPKSSPSAIDGVMPFVVER